MGQNVIIDRSIIHFSVTRLKNCDIDISILGPPNFLRCTLNSFFQYPRSCGFEINHGSWIHFVLDCDWQTWHAATHLWRVLECVAVEWPDLVVAEVDGAQARQAVQRAPLQLRQPVLAQVKLLQAHHVHEAPLEKEGNSTAWGDSTAEHVKYLKYGPVK